MIRGSLLSLCLVVALGSPALAGVDADVRATFERYKKAVLQRDGQKAVAEIDDRTLDYYARMRTAALSAPDIHNLSLLDKLMIVRLRHELSPDQLSAMDGRSLLAYAIGKGWVGDASVQRGGIGEVKVSGQTAVGAMTLGGKPTPAKLAFRRGKRGWLIDLLPLLGGAEPALQQLRQKSGLSEDELVLKMIEEATGRPVPAAVWRPLSPAVRR
jgi:hypothetical protein